MVNETVPKDILDKLNAGIEITGTDVDIRDLTSASDSVEVLQDTATDLKTEVHNAVGEVLLTGLYGWDGSIWETLNTDTNNRLLVAATGTFWQDTQPVSGTFWQVTQPVSATDLDIRNLTSASDSVEVYQNKAETISYGAISVDTEATAIVGAHSTRTGFIIVNNSDQTVYLGDDAVTTVNGLPLEAGASYENQIWVGVIYGIVAAGTSDIRVEDFY